MSRKGPQKLTSISCLNSSTLTLSTSSQVWHHTGWKQLASLRKKLESLKELRDLVRSLGRGGGKGPIRRAPQQIFQTVGI